MEALIKPEFGLMFWTILIFSLLVLVLSKTAWKPLLKAVEEREHAIRHNRESAEHARAEAEKMKADLEGRLAALKAEVESRLNEARAEGGRERDLIIDDARKSAALMMETAEKELEVRRSELARELRSTVAELSFMAAEKVLMKSVDHKSNRELVAQFLTEMETRGAGHKQKS